MIQKDPNRICMTKIILGMSFAFCATPSFATDVPKLFSHFGGTLGTSWSLGKLGNSDMGLDSRTMNIFSIEALPGYQFENWFIGPDFDYRWQGQITSLNSAG